MYVVWMPERRKGKEICEISITKINYDGKDRLIYKI